MIKPRPDLAIENVDGELIVLDKAASKVHQLNTSASFIWTCLSDGLDINETVILFSEVFDVEPAPALSDVQTTLAAFANLALVVE